MTDRRKPSPSDELLGRARGEAAGNEDAGDFALSSPADDYEAAMPFESEPIAELDHGLDFGDDMTAEEIASVLNENDTSDVPAETAASGPESSSLPAWATQEPDPDAIPVPAATPSSDLQRPSDLIVGEAPEELPPPPMQPDAVGDDDWSAGDRWTTPSQQWEEYEAQRAKKRQARTGFNFPVPGVRLLITLATFLFVFGGVIWNFFDGKEPIASVAVGDCFIVGEALEIDQVPIVECERKHDSELFAKVDMAVMGSSYPGDEAMFEWLFERCLEQFPGYVGEPYETSDYYIDMFIPLQDGWSEGDTTGLCTIVLVDENLNVRTVAGSGRNSGNSA